MEEGVEHGEVIDDNGNERFADRPFTCLFGAVGAGLDEVSITMGRLSLAGQAMVELTLRIKMQRRRPKTMMSIPPLNMIERTHFFRVTRLDFQIIYGTY